MLAKKTSYLRDATHEVFLQFAVKCSSFALSRYSTIIEMNYSLMHELNSLIVNSGQS
jgi:hypothetical protein